MIAPAARASAAVLPRLGVALVQIAAVAVGVFALTALLPGDTAQVVLGEHADTGQLEVLRRRLGLDQPWGTRFAQWAGGMLHGDLGTSLRTGRPVLDEITRNAATTALLTALTLLVVLPLAGWLGVRSGLRAGSRFDRAVNSVVVLLNSVPEFALALLLVGVFAVRAGWLPATAGGLSGWSLVTEPAVLVLPVGVLAAKQLSALARQVRTGVVTANGAEYATHVRRAGLGERDVVLRHVLPNTIGPVLQQLARTVDGLLGGVVVVEALFALGGIGSGFVEAVKARDLPVVQGYALLFAVITIGINLVIDLVARRFRAGAR
ncbi:ABC transporter permease [Saccharopolyspora gregorii]|uniref:ABC transporter permease n=1 Tax=Saccharopolyspora gregorii TaxID=33914 RepID=UPI0021AC6A0D|nr:ABC transporter permease [Saccharopolyspora gregorii]